MLRVRMRSDAGWSDAVVRNVSRRGMLIAANEPIKPGTYIEIRRLHHIIIARTMWSAKGRIGARTQDPIDVEGLIAAAAGLQNPGAPAVARPAHAPDRRSADRAKQSRDHGARLQFVALICAGAFVAFLIAAQVSASLSAPFEQVRLALAGTS